MRLSAVVPTLNAATTLSRALASLHGADEVIVADGRSTDGTPELAVELGARLITVEPGRGHQLAAGADAAEGDWLLFLHADTSLEHGWRSAVDTFVAKRENAGKAAVFRFALDDQSAAARRLEKLVAWRVRVLALPYGDQGLLIGRSFYRSLGGFRAIPLMEDVDLVRRIGRRRLVLLPLRAQTSAVRWREDGWTKRSLRNLACLSLYYFGVSPRRLLRHYGQ